MALLRLLPKLSHVTTLRDNDKGASPSHGRKGKETMDDSTPPEGNREEEASF